MTKDQFGLAGGTFGVVASLFATWLGGRLIGRYGLSRCIWPFVLAQNLLHILYTWVAWTHPLQTAGVDVVPPSFFLLSSVVVIEACGAGLGTSVFMVYLMRCCRPAYKAAHMAILTALMSLSFTFAGMFSGYLAEWMGYTLYFAFTIVAGVPGMLLIFVIPYLDGSSAADPRNPSSGSSSAPTAGSSPSSSPRAE
jgi:PAT family beta-lactamase induction signal transducer AmpG